MISSFHGMIPSFHGMIPSFHAVFGLRQRDKTAKVIDYNDQVIRVREYLIFCGIPSPMFFYGAVLLSLPTLFPDQLIVELLAEEVGPSHLYLHCVAQVVTMV